MPNATRRFLKILQVQAAAILLFLCSVAALADHEVASPEASRPIVDVQLGTPIYYDYGGDSWDPTWAQDDRLYAAVNDGAGFGTLKRNIGFNQISGSNPLMLTGQLQNPMDDYGEMNAPVATDGRNWKSGGSISVDGVLYMSIGMDRYVDPGYGGRQTRINASIIKSRDHGLHWIRAARDNLDRPMFPGMRFATPFFIHYGKEYAAATVDNADRYVYATSNNGFWDNGDNYILGRVPRSKIGALNAADWTFYQGGDGMLDSGWSADMTRAALLIDATGQCGETGVTYLPALKRYVMVAWYYPTGNGHAGNIETTNFAFYDSAKPWGPWKKIKTVPIEPQGWYIPRVLAKFQSPTGQGLQAFIAVAGDWRNPTYYRYTMVPVKFLTEALLPSGSLAPTPRDPNKQRENSP
jgi:hypothetical protein